MPCDPDVECLFFWEVCTKEPLHFCVCCPDNKKGAALNGMCKNIVCMDSPVGNEYGDCSAAKGVPVNQFGVL